MKAYFLSLSILIFSLICSIVALLHFSTPFFFIMDLIILALAFIPMSLFTSAQNYIFILIISLTIGFSFLFYAFFHRSLLTEQVTFMIQDLLITVTLILLWLLFTYLRKVFQQNVEFKKQINQLKKFEHLPHLLSYSEFINRATIILTGVKRRNEDCYVIWFNHVNANNDVEASMLHVITEIILQTVRADFDLVTLIDGKPLIFLQNTTKEGCYIVLDRLFKSLHQQLQVAEIPVSYQIVKVEENINQTLNDLTYYAKEVNPL